MTHPREPAKTRALERRAALKALGGAAALVAGAAATAHWKRAFAQSQKIVRLWTTQTGPTQVPVWKEVIAGFEKANPGLKVEYQGLSIPEVIPKLSASFVGGEVPEIIAGVNTAMPASLQDRGQCVSMEPVVKGVGDFSSRMLEIYNVRGFQFAIGLGLTVISTMWVRKDLLAEAGLGVPKHWDELAAAGKKLTKGTTAGLVLPFSKTRFGEIVVDMFVRQAGGDVIAPDGSPAFNGPGAIKALEFLKEIRPSSPVGASRYDFLECLNAFVSGQAAIGMYTGRVLVNVKNENPKIDDHIGADFYAYPRDGVAHWSCGYDAVFMPKGPKVNTAEAVMFLTHLYRPDNYTKWVLAAPGHQLPLTKRVADSKEFKEHPILVKHQKDLATMLAIADKAGVDIKPSSKHPIQLKMGTIWDSSILSQAMQRVLVDNEAPRAAAAWAHDEIAKILKS